MFVIKREQNREANHTGDFSSDIEDSEFLEAVLAQTGPYHVSFDKPIANAVPSTDVTDTANQKLDLHGSAEIIAHENEEYFTQDLDDFPLDGYITPSQLISAGGSDETIYDNKCSPCIGEALFDDRSQDASADG